MQFGDIRLQFGDVRCTAGTSATTRVDRVDLVTLLPETMLLRVRLAMPPGYSLRALDRVEGPGSLSAALDASPVNLVIVDPSDPRVRPSIGHVIRLLEQYTWIPCAVYTSLTPSGVAALPQLFRGGMQGLLLFGIDDGAAAIRELILRLTADAVAHLLLDALARPLRTLPPAVGRAIRFLFAAPHRFPSVEDLAVAAGMSRRHLHRLVTDAGLTSPTQLLVVARVLRAHQFLRAGGATIQQAAARLRLAPRILSRHVRLTTAVPGARALAELESPELVTRCVRTLYRPPAALRYAVGGAAPGLVGAGDRSPAPTRPTRPGTGS